MLANGQAARCWKSEALARVEWPTANNSTKRPRAHGRGGDFSARDLSKVYVIAGSRGAIRWRRRFGLPWPVIDRHELRAVDGVSFTISGGEVLGLVGESGSGKSTLARLAIRLIEPDSGEIIFNGKNVRGLRGAPLKSFRQAAQIVFQNPDSSLNPRRTVGNAVARAVRVHTTVSGEQRRNHVENLLDRVGLPRNYYDRYPHQLSGGEKQRVGMARALATEPTLIVCDEPVSALDVSVQATVLNLLSDLRDEFGLSYLIHFARYFGCRPHRRSHRGHVRRQDR